STGLRDLHAALPIYPVIRREAQLGAGADALDALVEVEHPCSAQVMLLGAAQAVGAEAGAGRVAELDAVVVARIGVGVVVAREQRSEEHTSELQSRFD